MATSHAKVYPAPEGPKTVAWTPDIETIPMADHDEDKSPDNSKVGNKGKPQVGQEGKDSDRLADLFKMLDAGHQAKFDIKLEQFFNLYDFDGSGNLTLAELIDALKLEARGAFTDEDVKQLLDEVDEDENDHLDLDEFKILVHKLRHIRKQRMQQNIKEWSDHYDYSKNEKRRTNRFCFNALQTLVAVRMKWLMVLLCMVVCGLSTPLLMLAHNGMHPNDFIYGVLQGSIWAFMPILAMGHWWFAFPTRYPIGWVALATAVACVWCMPYSVSYMCDGSVFMFHFDQERDASSTFVLTSCVGVTLTMSTFWFWQALYYGPITTPWYYAFSVLAPFFVIVYKMMGVFSITSIARNAVILLAFLLFVVLSSLAGYCGYKQPKDGVQGGQRGFISVAAFSIGILTMGLLNVFVDVYFNLDNDVLRIVMWLVWKFVAFCLINLWVESKNWINCDNNGIKKHILYN